MSAKATERSNCRGKYSLEANHCSEVKEYGTISKYLYQQNKQTWKTKQNKKHNALYCHGITPEIDFRSSQSVNKIL